MKNKKAVLIMLLALLIFTNTCSYADPSLSALKEIYDLKNSIEYALTLTDSTRSCYWQQLSSVPIDQVIYNCLITDNSNQQKIGVAFPYNAYTDEVEGIIFMIPLDDYKGDENYYYVASDLVAFFLMLCQGSASQEEFNNEYAHFLYCLLCYSSDSLDETYTYENVYQSSLSISTSYDLVCISTYF